MLQAALADCLLLDPFPFSENSFVASEVDVNWCDVVQALVVTLVILVIRRPRSDVQDRLENSSFPAKPVLHGQMPAFDLALGLRCQGRGCNQK